MAHGQEDRNPVVLGRIGRDPSKPTVCFYGALIQHSGLNVGTP